MIEVFEIDRGQRDHSTSGGSLGYLYTIVALRIYISVGNGLERIESTYNPPALSPCSLSTHHPTSRYHYNPPPCPLLTNNQFLQ